MDGYPNYGGDKGALRQTVIKVGMNTRAKQRKQKAVQEVIGP